MNEMQMLVQRGIAAGLLSVRPRQSRPKRVPKGPVESKAKRPYGVKAELQTLANQFGVGVSTVCRWRKNGALRRGANGEWTLTRPKAGAPARHDWSTVDWSRPDGEIAQALGCSRSAVQHRRGKMENAKLCRASDGDGGVQKGQSNGN